ncbi:MAG: 50S ribosomal protein L22 [Chloroflexota bacterium]
MEVRAVAKGVGLSPLKVRPAADMVRGLAVEEALIRLRFTPSASARAVAKVVRSAAANAENNLQMAAGELKVSRIYVDDGPRLKRFRPQSKGRISPILKRSCHITVVVEGEIGT